MTVSEVLEVKEDAVHMLLFGPSGAKLQVDPRVLEWLANRVLELRGAEPDPVPEVTQFECFTCGEMFEYSPYVVGGDYYCAVCMPDPGDRDDG